MDNLESWREHEFQVKCGYDDGSWGKWSEKITVKAEGSTWKECPDDIYGHYNIYSVDGNNQRVATKTNEVNDLWRSDYCTIIGSTPLPLNKVTSWSIKMLKSRNNDGGGIYIGVAPFDIDQNEESNHKKCGWYFHCYGSTLYSGPPHNYKDKEYGPRKRWGEYIHRGDSVGVVMDTTKGELSFIVDGVSLGVAYSGIPLDKHLVPCVLLRFKGYSVKLII